MIPSYFIAHGAPILAMEENEYTKTLKNLSLPRPRAVVLFSAHWESTTQKVSQVDEYQTMYDFGGFPDALYQIKYPAQGDDTIANEIIRLIENNHIPYEVETERGLDHGAWVVLRLLYPEADIPVITMSVNPHLKPEEQYKIGKSLAALRANDILIIGSGGTVHNLQAINMAADDGRVDEWALTFDKWLEGHLQNWDIDTLFNYDSLAPHAERAVPAYGKEHFIPIFYAMGAADDHPHAKLIHRSYRYGNLSHSIWQFGGR